MNIDRNTFTLSARSRFRHWYRLCRLIRRAGYMRMSQLNSQIAAADTLFWGHPWYMQAMHCLEARDADHAPLTPLQKKILYEVKCYPRNAIGCSHTARMVQG